MERYLCQRCDNWLAEYGNGQWLERHRGRRSLQIAPVAVLVVCEQCHHPNKWILDAERAALLVGLSDLSLIENSRAPKEAACLVATA